MIPAVCHRNHSLVASLLLFVVAVVASFVDSAVSAAEVDAVVVTVLVAAVAVGSEAAFFQQALG